MTTRRKMCQIKGISEAKMEKIKVKSKVTDLEATTVGIEPRKDNHEEQTPQNGTRLPTNTCLPGCFLR